MTAHSALSASGAHRWLACPGSVSLSEGMTSESGVDARTGSCAHKIAEACLLRGEYCEAAEYIGATVKEYEEIEVTEEMCDAVQVYLDAVRATSGELDVEMRFDLSHIYDGMFGTCDAVVYDPGSKKLTVFDYKHGYRAVSPEQNPQAMYYAVGALTGKHNRGVSIVELVIVQPRAGGEPVKRWECDPLDLVDFIFRLKRGAEATTSDNPQLVPGDHCRYCPAAPKCPALRQKVEEIAMGEFDVPKKAGAMTPEELSVVWFAADMIEAWIDSIKSYAHTKAIAGEVPPGLKLVEGRATRKWRDEDVTVEKLNELVREGYISEIYAPDKILSPSAIEKKLGKKNGGLIAELWEKGTGSLSLVPMADKRPKAKAAAEEEF